MMEVVVTTGAISRAKLQSNHHHQQTNIQFFYRPDALSVALIHIFRKICLRVRVCSDPLKCHILSFKTVVG